MYISEIAIEGFKSYASRVTLTNFDQTFNAITGLNGSGKSNILDSICFVLGIKNLTQVRATNLQELVYKQGQAGITKATVSITWHNDDPKNGPPGYEDKEYITITRQIVIGGRNKYLINGHAAQEGRVQDLFHSVQLNVNNPHFLIMQGRITKVLNMKPPEILSLLEEAAGTRMYEKKKEQAIHTLEKKQAKLEQIDSVLNHDILPSLELLRGQCSQYKDWTEASSRLERLKRILVAHDFCECIKQGHRYTQEVARMEGELTANTEQRDRIKAELEEKQGVIRDLQTEKEIQAGGEIKELQGDVDRLSMDLTKDSTSWKAKRDALESEQKALKGHQAALAELEAQDLEKKLAQAEEAREGARARLASAEAGVEAAQRELAGAEAGDGRDESNRSLQERLADAQTAQTSADSDAKAADVRAKHLAKQLAEAKKAAASKEAESAGLGRELAKQQAAVEAATTRLKALGFDEAAFAGLESERERASLEVRRARDEVDRLAQEVAGCDFRYHNPGGSFNPAAVHGVVARLVRVQDPSTSLALEVAAGGKLYQVVVDNEHTAKDLLERGRLTKRVTIIPLNKVQYPNLPQSVLAAAERMGGGKAKPALQLVGYAHEVEAAMKYAFGGAFVCEDAGTAKKLAFSREVGTRCVTLEGDDFNPSGLLTGGSRASSRSLLASLHALGEAESALASAQQRVQGLDAQLAGMRSAAKEHRKLRQEEELASHALTLLKDRMAGSEAAQLAAAVEQLASDLAAAQAAAEEARKRKNELVATAKGLEHEIANFSKERDKRVKAAQDKLKKAKAELESAKSALRAAEQAVTAAVAEKEAAAQEFSSLEAKVAAAQAAIQGLEADAEALRAATATAKAAYEAAAARLETRRARLRECDSEISSHEKAAAKLAKALDDCEADARKIDSKIKGRAEQARSMADSAAKLERDFAWVATEKAAFGTGDYDFSKYDLRELKKEYAQVEHRVSELKGKVNGKCIDKLDKAEKEFSGLTEKRNIVERDRQRITEVISELDDKKKMAMKETWQKVNRDFGSIFSTLLPGTQAKLEPPEGQSFLEGLEVRVAFGGVWKDSLTELSGGQRSLLALSLILALCRFKPAPLYILDEVDAALDLNHTQNIGRMIKQHFPQSQFIVVSLKEGMFSNANVIFRTKFVDGVSTVTRTVPSAAERAMRGPMEDHAGGKGVLAAAGNKTLPAGRSALRDANR